jgi:NADPH-dependent glutamate synthase beta subunit-like oxidoreductase
MGHPVTLLESEEEIGGLLRWGIPEYRLPGKVLERDLARVLSLGIRVVKGAMAAGAALEDLAREHKAVFLAPGAQKARDLRIPGTELQGLLAGVEFLHRVRRGDLPGISGRAVVIGGGNVAIDSALSARRLGADKVTLVSLEKREEMPAHERERQDALEEGIEFLNGWGPTAFIGKEGRVAGVRFSRCVSLFDAGGNFHPVYDQADTMALDTDLVVSAIGQTPDPSFLKEIGDLAALACEGPLRVDGSTLRTALPNVFAGGDVVRFPGSVAEAIGAGKRAAIAIHLSTTGEPFGNIEERIAMGGGPSLSIQALFNRRSGWDATSVVKFENLEPLFLQYRERRAANRLAAEERGRGFDEITLGFDPREAQSEAERCFSCGTCTGCDRCYNFCPELSLLPPGGERKSYEADPDYCKGCAVCASVCPRGVMSMGKEK